MNKHQLGIMLSGFPKTNSNLIDLKIKGVKALYFFLVSITYMSLLSKSEILYLQIQKQVSRSYEYKLKSIIKKKVANLMDKEIPLLSKLFPDPNLTEISKTLDDRHGSKNLTEISKTTFNKITTNNSDKVTENYDNSVNEDKNFNYNGSSPAQIRTGVKGSKGLYACPLHSVFNNATGLSGHFIIKFTFIISFTN